jgi:hypothetical protein
VLGDRLTCSAQPSPPHRSASTHHQSDGVVGALHTRCLLGSFLYLRLAVAQWGYVTCVPQVRELVNQRVTKTRKNHYLQHINNITTSLQRQLATVSEPFKTLLEVRSARMKAETTRAAARGEAPTPTLHPGFLVWRIDSLSAVQNKVNRLPSNPTSDA